MIKYSHIFILFLFLQICFADETKTDNKQVANQVVKLDISFLSKTESSKVLGDESKSPYYQLLESLDIQAKTKHSIIDQPIEDMRKACSKTYQENTLDFSEEEKNTIIDILNYGKDFFGNKYKLLATTPWKFIKTTDSVEGGLPHTRNDCIIFPAKICNQFELLKAIESTPHAQFLKIRLLDLLIHEQTHVLQRKHPIKFANFNTELLKFTQIKIDLNHDWLKKNQVINPDGPRAEWMITLTTGEEKKTELLMPFLVFIEKDGPRVMPYDFKKILLQIDQKDGKYSLIHDEKGLPKYHNIDDVDEYKSRFKLTPTNNYHPNEISADIIAKIVSIGLMHSTLKEENIKTHKFVEVYKPYSDWLEKEFN